MESTNKVFKVIQDRILEEIKKDGQVPWRKPWVSGSPKNFVSGKQYRGINHFTLRCIGDEFYMSFLQIKERKGHLRKGSKGIPIIFYTPGKVAERDASNGETTERTIPYLRYFMVFKQSDIEGIEFPTPVKREINKIESAEKIVAGFTDKPQIDVDGRACYRPMTDTIGMPAIENFLSDEAWYATLFHELGHSTGHESRLNRKEVVESNIFGSTSYGKEELVAEMTAAFLCGESGISNRTIENQAAYLKGWLAIIKSDVTLLVKAGSAAQKAFDYIMGVKADTV